VALARCRLLQKDPFFGHLLNFFRAGDPRGHGVKTAAVWIDGEGRPVLAYSPKFIDGLTVEETVVILRHELEHIYRLHPLRARAWGKEAFRNHGPLNWAMDAVVHGHHDRPLLEGLSASKKLMDMSVFLPPEIHSRTTVEQLVGMMPRMTAREFLEKVFKLKELKVVRDEKGRWILVGRRGNEELASPQPSESKKPGHGLPVWVTDDLELALDRLGDHEVWGDSPDEVQLRGLLGKMLRESAENAPGNVPGDLSEILRELSVPTVDWKRALRSVTGRQLGGARRTYSRRNRRYNKFGIKGQSHHARDRLLVLVDVSGSISSKNLEDFFAEIESISSGFAVELVTFDAQVQPVSGEYVRTYRRGDWRIINLRGGGGTSFINAFGWVDDHRLWARCNVVLTDGYAPWPTGYDGLELIWCLAKGKRGIRPPFGDVVRIGGENR